MKGVWRECVVCMEISIPPLPSRQNRQAFSGLPVLCLSAVLHHILLSVQGVDLPLYLIEKSGQMKSVCNRMMYVHGQGQDQLSTLLLIPAPGDDRGKKLPLVKYMDIKVPIPDPGQAGHIKMIGRLVLCNGPQSLILLPVPQKTGVEFPQFPGIWGDQLCEVLVLRMKMGIAGRNKIPPDQIAVSIPSIFNLNSSRLFTTFDTIQIMVG